MAIARKLHSGRRARFAPALIAMLALMVQALLPSTAMAAQAGNRGETMVICTGAGVQTVRVGEAGGGTQKRGVAGLPCQDCLAAATAALPAPEPAAVRVAYATAWTLEIPRQDLTPRSARAPPRPPGQGPPTA